MTSHLKSFTNPWPHVVIDNFLPDNVFQDLLDEVADLQEPQYFRNGIETHHASIIQTLNISIDQSITDLLFPLRPHTKLEISHQINVAHPNVEYPIHDEAPRKLVSLVLYISGGTEGTVLYDENQNYAKTVEWKPNRAMIFAGKDDVTWHSYKAGPERRITGTTFLMNSGKKPVDL